jgi:replication initiation and membrane attachment protein
MSNEYTHHHLMTNMKISLDEIVLARKKLEAIGLLKTYYKNGDINNYVYELYSPLSASEFFSNPILAVSLSSSVGKKEYDDLVAYYKMPKINLNDFENVSARFSDIYMMSSKNIEDVTEKNMKKKEKLDVLVDNIVDFNFIESSNKGLLNRKALTDNIKSLINKLVYLYNFDNITISNIIKNSINDKGMISEIEFKKNCKNYYSFENKGQTPNLVYKTRNKIEYDKDVKDLRTKLINCFECVTPYDFLKAKYKGGSPTTKDVTLLESLLVNQKLNPGVINVLVDYVLRVNDKKLNKNLVESIASQWKMIGIDTVEDAMKQAEKEYRKHNQYKEIKDKKVNVAEEKLPHWYGKEIKKEQMTEDEKQELKDMLKEFM